MSYDVMSREVIFNVQNEALENVVGISADNIQK